MNQIKWPVCYLVLGSVPRHGGEALKSRREESEETTAAAAAVLESPGRPSDCQS